MRTIAFRAISCGVYGYPFANAAAAAVGAVCAFLREHPVPERVTLVAFDETVAESLTRALATTRQAAPAGAPGPD